MATAWKGNGPIAPMLRRVSNALKDEAAAGLADKEIRLALRRAVAESMKRAWASYGASIGYSWYIDASNTPHVETGRLRAQMTHPMRLKLRCNPFQLSVGSDIEYARDVVRMWGNPLNSGQGEFRKIDETARQEIGAIVRQRWLERIRESVQAGKGGAL